MMKKTRTDFVSSTSWGDRENRFKYQTLKQEYQELREEVVFKRRNLEMMKQKLSTLKAEVGFLRRRYKHLKQDQTLETSQKMLTLSESGEVKVPSKPPSGKRKKDALANNGSCDLENKPKRSRGNENSTNSLPDLNGERNTSLTNEVSGFDLNQISREDEEPEANGAAEATKNAVDDDLHYNLKVPICRDVEKEGKRKVTWRDPVALTSLEVFSKNMK